MFLALAGEEQCRKYGLYLSELKSNFDNVVSTANNPSKNSTKLSQNLIKLNYSSSDCEKVSLFKLLESDNKILSKILLVFGVLKEETRYLNFESRRIQQILVFFDDELTNLGSEDKKLTNEEYNNLVIVKFSANLEHFVRLKYLVQKLIFVANHYVQQLSALFLNDKFVNVQLTNCFPVSF